MTHNTRTQRQRPEHHARAVPLRRGRLWCAISHEPSGWSPVVIVQQFPGVQVNR